MNVKISPEFWSDPDIENLSPETKLAVLWLLTNPRVNLVGYAEISEKRFCFDTGLKPEALAEPFKALPKSFIRDERGYWIRAFIRHQFGQGEPLLRNNYCKPLLRDLKALASPSVVLLVLNEYPELKTVFTEGESAKGLGSPTQAPEQNRTEQLRTAKLRTAQGGAGGGIGRQPSDLAEAVAFFATLSAPEAEAVKFFNHYEANGWKQGGRAALRSWHSAARSWVIRWREGGGGQGSKISPGGGAPAGGGGSDLPQGAGGVCLPDPPAESTAGEGGAL